MMYIGSTPGYVSFFPPQNTWHEKRRKRQKRMVAQGKHHGYLLCKVQKKCLVSYVFFWQGGQEVIVLIFYSQNETSSVHHRDLVPSWIKLDTPFALSLPHQSHSTHHLA